MTGKTCAGLWVTGTGKDGEPRSTYLYHVVDNEWSMQEYGHQCVVWQTAINPVVALELLATGVWKGSGVLGPGGVRRGAVPRPADRLRQPVGAAGGGAMTGGPTLPQERRLVTEIPGPESLARLDRKKAHVADGVGTMLPVFVVAAGGGVLVDVDGNSLIDLGSGHRGGHGRQRGRRGGAQRPGPGRRVHPHLLHDHAVRRVRRRLRGPRRADARGPRQEVARCSTPARRPSRTP